MTFGALVMVAILAALCAGFLLFHRYSRTPAWRDSETRMAMMRLLVIIGPMFGMRFDRPPPDRPAVMGGLGPDAEGRTPDDPAVTPGARRPGP
jgi:hypothetical protein